MTSDSSNRPASASPRAEAREAANHRLSRVLGWTLVPLALVVVWELSARALDLYLYPTAGRVFSLLAHPLADQYQQGSLLGNTLVSFLRVLIGFAVAAAAGLVVGLALGSSHTLRHLFEPVFELLRPLCPIAWIPFAIAVFGLTTLPQLVGIGYSRSVFGQVQIGMLFVLFWGGFFPVMVNTLDGVAAVRRNYLALARTLGASSMQTFLHVRLPAALPNALTGLRQGIGTCWFVLIAAEMLPGTNSGLGYLLMQASDLSAMDLVVACMVIIGGVGAALNFALRGAMRRVVAWKGRET